MSEEKQRYLRIMHCNGSQDNTDLEVGRLLIARMEKTKMGVVEVVEFSAIYYYARSARPREYFDRAARLLTLHQSF